MTNLIWQQLVSMAWQATECEEVQGRVVGWQGNTTTPMQNGGPDG